MVCITTWVEGDPRYQHTPIDNTVSSTSNLGYPGNLLGAASPETPKPLTFEVPWPGKTYYIVQHDSARAITKVGENLLVRDLEEGENNKWMCVWNRGYMGFYEKHSGKYMGHNGKRKMRAATVNPDGWECIVAQLHPGGSFRIMLPNWSDLEHLVVAEDGKSLEMRKNGHVLWDFVEV